MRKMGQLFVDGQGEVGSVGVVVLGFVVVIIFVIALGWLAIVSRPK